jgi:cation diffusion facilitator CzcD-associated flavoprotein CzcO
VSVVVERETSQPPMPAASYDAVVVGAGPYGLSSAAHLRGRGLEVAVFGKPMELWRDHMPRGMRLRSHWWATNLSDPGRRHGFARFLRESKYRRCYPEPADAFIDYARWFQERVVPDVDATYVSSVERRPEGFLLTLADGRRVRSAAVVMAVGLVYYAHRPVQYRALSSRWVSHSCEHSDLGRFHGARVIVVGGGQSALEYAALLHEAGATVHVVARRPIDWLAPDRIDERGWLERLRAPRSGIAPGWINWVLEHAPYLFYRLPRVRKDRALAAYLPAAVSAWLRDRVLGKVTVHEGRTVVRMDVVDDALEATLSDGVHLGADHVILATGYRIDVTRLPMLHPSLRNAIETDAGAPRLSPWFEASVPGLYFVGLTSLPAFGPLFRFVVGCKAAAPRVAAAVARRQGRRR